jgi:hypothetical protein
LPAVVTFTLGVMDQLGADPLKRVERIGAELVHDAEREVTTAGTNPTRRRARPAPAASVADRSFAVSASVELLQSMPA